LKIQSLLIFVQKPPKFSSQGVGEGGIDSGDWRTTASGIGSVSLPISFMVSLAIASLTVIFQAHPSPRCMVQCLGRERFLPLSMIARVHICKAHLTRHPCLALHASSQSLLIDLLDICVTRPRSF
jgi:hypothetical protein